MNKQLTYFTFGQSHTHPITGKNMAKTLVAVYSEPKFARMGQCLMFADKWAFQYNSIMDLKGHGYKVEEVLMYPPLKHVKLPEPLFIDDVTDEVAWTTLLTNKMEEYIGKAKSNTKESKSRSSG